MVMLRCSQRLALARSVVRSRSVLPRKAPLLQQLNHFHYKLDHHQLLFARASTAFSIRLQSNRPLRTDGEGEQNNEVANVSNSIKKIEDIKRMRMTIKMLRKDLEREIAMEKAEQDRKEKMQLQVAERASLQVRVWNKVKNPKELGRDIWHELLHYYHGFRLFGVEARLSMKYLWKLIKGKQPLLRKERQQMIRTSADIIRLIPFSVFIIVPFMELLLPFYIKFFPQMMPTPFHDMSKEDEKHLKQLRAKMETARFLQDTLEEISEARKDQEEASGLSAQAYEFSQFLKKIRTGEGGYVSNEDLFKFMKLFEDELTLDNLSMVQLRALCRLLGISKIGTPEILRFRLHMKLRELKADDRLIDQEGGVDVLSAQELQAACRARGMRALGLSEERLRVQLKQWVELSLDDQVPPSLLLLSRAMYFPEETNITERLRSILGTLPNEIGDHKELELKQLEGESDPKAKIALLKSIEAALKAERKLREDLENKKREKREREEERRAKEELLEVEGAEERNGLEEARTKEQQESVAEERATISREEEPQRAEHERTAPDEGERPPSPEEREERNRVLALKEAAEKPRANGELRP